VYNIVAISLSLLALSSSSYLAAQQIVLQRRANHLPAYLSLLENFRSVKYHDHYRFVCDRLPTEHDPELGISGLPLDARAAVYDVAYLLQHLAAYRVMGIVDDLVVGTFNGEMVEIWDAIAPFVIRERQLHYAAPVKRLRLLEEYANEVRGLPNDGPGTIYVRRLRLRRALGKRRLAELPGVAATSWLRDSGHTDNG